MPAKRPRRATIGADPLEAVVHLYGPPVRLTLAALAETTFRAEFEQLKKEHHMGKSYPRKNGDLKGGMPIGS